MKTSQAGIALIKNFEGLRLQAYQDIAGIWTIGYGSTKDVRRGDTCTEAEAVQMLADDLKPFEAAVGKAIGKAKTRQAQFDAMVSLAYNIGSGNFARSTVLRDHVAGLYPQAANAFRMWNKATVRGQLVVVNGLTRRREIERNLYLS